MGGKRAGLAGITAIAIIGLGLLGGMSAAADTHLPDLDVPATIGSGEQLRISGSNCSVPEYLPQPTVILSINGEISTTTANIDGNWGWYTDALPPGTVTVAASCEDYAQTSAYPPATVEVIDRATIAVVPGTVQAGSTVTVTGTDWAYACDCIAPGVELTLTNGVDTWSLSTSIDPEVGDWNPAWNWSGSVFSVAVDLPAGLAPGQYTLSGKMDIFHQASTTLTIEGDQEATPSVVLSSPSVVAGGTIDVLGSGFLPGEQVRIELHSTPSLLTTATAASDGSVEAKVSIPATTTVGAHSIVLVGVDSDRTATANLEVTSVPPGGGGTGTTGGGGTGTTGGGSSAPATENLAATGGGAPGMFIGIAALMVALGTALIWARRRDVRA